VQILGERGRAIEALSLPPESKDEKNKNDQNKDDKKN
jgi:hypothetical protein